MCTLAQIGFKGHWQVLDYFFIEWKNLQKKSGK